MGFLDNLPDDHAWFFDQSPTDPKTNSLKEMVPVRYDPPDTFYGSLPEGRGVGSRFLIRAGDQFGELEIISVDPPNRKFTVRFVPCCPCSPMESSPGSA